VPVRMKFVPTVVHNLPHLGYRFERCSSQFFAEACCSQSSCRRAGWRNSGSRIKGIESWTV